MSEKNEFLDISYCYTGRVKTPVGEIPTISTALVFKDKCDAYKARWGIKRSSYKVQPGVYAIGSPNASSPMLVTANYKLTFDMVRKNMDGQNAWLMVIDTRGVNVWCAAGKGTFGTKEVVGKCKAFKIDRIIEHKTLILPQLAATGVAAHEVTKATGFKVVYGPVDSKDLPEFIDGGNIATSEMATVKFGFRARIVLTPIELMTSLKYCLIALAFFFFFNWIGSEMFFSQALLLAILSTIPYLGAIIVGAVLVPMLLPFLLGSVHQPHETIRPAGLGARDTLRIEAGMPLYGHELHEGVDPLLQGPDIERPLLQTRRAEVNQLGGG